MVNRIQSWEVLLKSSSNAFQRTEYLSPLAIIKMHFCSVMKKRLKDKSSTSLKSLAPMQKTLRNAWIAADFIIFNWLSSSCVSFENYSKN